MCALCERSFMTVVLLLGALPAMAERQATNAAADVYQSIRPALDPESDKKFFKQDYPDDVRARRDSKLHKFDFSHPYPIVQDSEDYDKDYIKDENADGGEWKAQMTYDDLRSKIRQQIKEVEDAKKQVELQTDDLKKAKKEEDVAEDEAKRAEKASEKARSDAEAAGDKLEEVAGGGSGGEVGDAVQNVEKEMKDLEGCKKALAAARANLKKLLEEKVQREKVENEAVVEKETVDEEVKAAESSAKIKKSVKAAKSMDVKETVEEERVDVEKAKKTYEKETQEVKETEEALDKAAKRLREIRKGVDPDGGVYYKKDSAAVRAVLPNAALAALVACVAALTA